MVRTKVGTNLNRKSCSHSIPIVFDQLLSKLEDAGFIASKSEGVRSALSEWLLINIALLEETFSELDKPKIEMNNKTKRMWKDIIKVVNEHDRTFGGYEIN